MKSKLRLAANRPIRRGLQARLPHEHDESSDSQNGGVRNVMKQAHDDIVTGQQDTDLHGTPGLDKPAK